MQPHRVPLGAGEIPLSLAALSAQQEAEISQESLF